MSEKGEVVVALVERPHMPAGFYTNLYHCTQCGLLCEEGLIDDYGRCPKCAAERGEHLDDLATGQQLDLRLEEEAGCRKP